VADLLHKAAVQGYANRLSVAPGERVEFKVSCEEPGRYRADVVRLIHGDTSPAGPGFKEEPIETEVSGDYPGRLQPTDAGSCVVVEDGGALGLTGPFTLHAFIQPTTPGKPDQGILGRFATASGTGYALVIEEGAPALLVGDGVPLRVSSRERLFERCWYSVAASFDPATGTGRLYCEPVVNAFNSRLSPAVPIGGAARVEQSIEGALGDSGTPFTVGGLAREPGDDWVDSHFNGKIDRPAAWSRVLSQDELDGITSGGEPPTDGLVAAWDFAEGIGPRGIPSDRVADKGASGLHGTCVNFPARGMTGWNWHGIEERFTHAPEQYGALHFHEDDLEDAKWETDIAWTVPDDFRSGVYGLRVRLGEVEEHFPFFVLPPRGEATARALFLVPTASYLAYANEHLVPDVPVSQAIFGHTSVLAERDLYLYRHTELGLSTYDLHADGSGVHYSSSLRPIVGFRPKHRLGIGGPWQFPADLHLVDWLDAMGIDYDVATDRELHDEGTELLERYQVVMTGSHPEYYSREMLDAWEEYLGNGGRGMYLGSNGFYWIISWHPDKRHLMEVRKAELGSRAWQAEAGEYYMQTNGERSGLWRGRARAPQKLFGVGFTTEGFDESSYYVQMPDAQDPGVAFIMEGIDSSERIGDFGLVGGGAAGYELDRYDLQLGTPPHARLLAYSEGHSDNYPHVVEEILFMYPHLGGTMDHQVRADIVYFPTRNGGAVFSTSSIAWCGSLSHNDYENNVSRMTSNVLRRFLDEEPL
jgi:N,N-dimethylformamidase